jgi:hypothetical protein
LPTLTFTTSGTWEAAASSVDCQCTGEGGNGADGASGASGHGGGGGGGGAYAEETTLALNVGTNYSYTIGTGGSSTATSFPGQSVTVTAAYGVSVTGTNESGGAGGAAGSNSIANAGGAGASGQSGSGSKEGGGGGGAAGASGNGGAASGATGGTGTDGGGSGGGGEGDNGSAPGGGGGGGSKANTFGNPGGDGAAGQIVIIYTASTAGTATLAGVGTLTASGGILGANNTLPQVNPGPAWLHHFGYQRRHLVPPFDPPATVHASAFLSGTGTLTALGTAPEPAVVNQWSNSYGQGTTFTSITSALQSCVTPLNPANSVGPGSGYPTEGNWLFTIATWTQDPSIINVHVGVGDDIHSYWREYPASGPDENVRTSISYTPNTARQVGNVYVAPDMEIAAINVLVVEVANLGNWDTVVGTDVAYTANGTSVSLSQAAGASGTFFMGAVGGDNVSSGQAFLPSGWQGLVTQTQTNGSDTLADNILTAAYLPLSSSTQNVSGTASTAEDLSAFLLAVLVSGNSPIPAGSNPNWPHVIFEAGFGSGFNTPDSEITWTDISSRLWEWDETTGIQFELGQLQSTNLDLHLDNYDGYISPENSSSPYYPNVIPGTPLRMRAALGTMGGNTYNRWYIIQRNAMQWGEEIDDVFRRYCPVTGTDLWAALSATPPTFYRSEVYEDNPYAWWPMDDQPGTSGILPTQLLNAAIGNTNTLNVTLSPSKGVAQPYLTESGVSTGSGANAYPPGIGIYTAGSNQGWMFGDPQGQPASLGTGNPVSATPGSASWQASGQAGSSGSYGWYLTCTDSSFPTPANGITVEIWFNYQYYGGPTGYNSSLDSGTWSPITQQPYDTTFSIWNFAGAGLELNTSGHLQLVIGATTIPVYTSSDLRSNSWHMATVTLTSSTYGVWLDGGAGAQVSGSASPGGGDEFTINSATGGGGNAAFAHAAIYPYVLPYYRIMDHYWAAITAFGQLPAPTGIQISFNDAQTGLGTEAAQNAFAPDGTSGYLQGEYNAGSGIAVSAIVAATAPDGVTSGPSAWATGAAQYYSGDEGQGRMFLWISWNGLAPSFSLYTASTLGDEAEAAVVNGTGDSFNSGFGSGASGAGVSQVSGGTGSSPPTAASSIGDTVGQRIERLMRGGRCTSPNRCIDPAPLLVQAPGTTGGGTQVGAQVQALQQSDSGMLYVDNCNHLTYWQRPHLAGQYSSPVWNIGPTTSTGRIPYYREIQWITDPQRIWNAIGISPLSPTGAALPIITPQNASEVDASQVQYGAQPLQITSWLQETSEMQNQANWLFEFYGTPQRRAQQVKIDAAAYPQAWELVLGVNIGDIVQLEDWIIGGGGTVYTYRVTEMKRHISGGLGVTGDRTATVELTLDYEPTSYWS